MKEDNENGKYSSVFGVFVIVQRGGAFGGSCQNFPTRLEGLGDVCANVLGLSVHVTVPTCVLQHKLTNTSPTCKVHTILRASPLDV